MGVKKGLGVCGEDRSWERVGKDKKKISLLGKHSVDGLNYLL